MGDPVTGYVIYYQPKGGAVSSDMVSGGETETHLLDGLQRGVTYNISIVAQSRGLRSLVVGPVNVPGILILPHLCLMHIKLHYNDINWSVQTVKLQ